METKKIEQKGLTKRFGFGKSFYALVCGLALALAGGSYFFVFAGELEIQTDINNAVQTIKQIIVTSDGTAGSDEYFNFNSDGDGGAKFYNIKQGSIQKNLGLDIDSSLVYSVMGTTDDGDWIKETNGVYTTGKVSIGASDYSSGLLSVINSDTGFAELYLKQTNDKYASKIWFNNTSETWTIGADSSPSWFYIGLPGEYPYFSISDIGNVIISGDLNMTGHDINNANIVTAVAFVMSSDKNLKENIQIIKNPLDKIYALNGYTFDWKKERVIDGRKHDVGLIAQEVEKVLPELVHVDTSGHKGVQYANMVALLIEGVKELGNKIDGLYSKYLDQQDQIKDLELRIKKLENK